MLNHGLVVFKFTEDLVSAVVHVLTHRQELRGWTRKKTAGPPARVQVLAAQLLSEMRLQGKCPSVLLDLDLRVLQWHPISITLKPGSASLQSWSDVHGISL